jgi:hypothetical protein
MLLAAGDLLCTEESDALQCFADPSRYTVGGAKGDSPPLAMKVRVAGAKDVTAVAAEYGAFCTLSGGALACAKRVNSGSSPALEELSLTRVDGLKSPTKIWSGGLDIFVLDGDRIIQLDDRNGFALKVWERSRRARRSTRTRVTTGSFTAATSSFARRTIHFRSKYDIGGKPSQVISLDLDTCALVDGRAMCFGY